MTDRDVCVHCGSRNTAHLEGLEHECHDCGKTYGVPALVQADGKGEWVDGITHIEVLLDGCLLKYVERLRKAMLAVEADYISAFYHVDTFNVEEEVRSDCIMLVVGKHDFHFEGNFKNSPEEWYTESISLDGKTYKAWEEA